MRALRAPNHSPTTCVPFQRQDQGRRTLRHRVLVPVLVDPSYGIRFCLLLLGPSTPMDTSRRLGSSANLHLADLLTSTPWNLSVPIYRATSTTQRLLATSHREHLAT